MTQSHELDGLTPSRVERPSTIDELSEALAAVHSSGEAAVLWGGGTRMHVGNPVRKYDVAVDMTALNRMVEYQPSDLVVIVEAGITVAALQAELARNGQRLAFDPPCPERSTIGGAVASNAVGPLRGAFGGVRDLVIGMTVVQADGVVTKSGGRVVKNVTGYDMARLHIGALGTLGAIGTLAFKVGPIPAVTRTVAAWFPDLDAASQAAMSLFNGPFMPEAMSLVIGQGAADFVRGHAEGTGAASDDEPALLLVRVAGGPATAQRQLDDTLRVTGAAMASGVETLDDAASEEAWALAGEPSEPSLLSVCATFKPKQAFAFLDSMQKARDAFELTAALHVGFGTVMAHWTVADGETPGAEAIRAKIDSVRRAAASQGGHALIERAPLEVKRDTDVFGDMGASLEVMRRMKREFDPDGNLSPGRFAGGI